MNKDSTIEKQASWDPDEAPTVTEEEMDRAVYRVGFQPVEREEVRVEMTLDSALLQFFKNRAGEQGYLSLIREALAEYARGREIEEVVRRAVREELDKTGKLGSVRT